MTTAQNAVRILSVFLLFVGSVLIPRTQINGQMGTSSMSQEGALLEDQVSGTSKHLLTVNDVETNDNSQESSPNHSDDDLEDAKQFNFHEIFVRLHVNEGGKETDFMDQNQIASKTASTKTSLASAVANQQESHLSALADLSSDDGEEISESESSDSQIEEPKPTPQAQALQCLTPVLDSVETVCASLTTVRSAAKPLWRRVKKSYTYKTDQKKKTQLLGLYNSLLKLEVARKTLQKELGCSTCWAATSTNTAVLGTMTTTTGLASSNKAGCVDCSVRALETIPTACSVLSAAVAEAERLSFVVSHSSYLKGKFPETYQVSSHLSTSFNQLSTQLKCGQC